MHFNPFHDQELRALLLSETMVYQTCPPIVLSFTMVNVTLYYHGKCYRVLPWYLGKWKHVVGVASVTMVTPGNAKCSLEMSNYRTLRDSSPVVYETARRQEAG